ncbi:hypothetical protein [Mesorhizobium sp. M0843]|uniref:hypothetical protein n=1 Tax=Mesorhizobium sp. M0843 TaxID=2957010 RepID=UPI0033377C48
MSLYFNDLSINGKFTTSESVISSLLTLYAASKALSLRLVVFKDLLLRSAIGDSDLHSIIVMGGSSQRGLLLGWLAKSGPFGEDDQLHVDDDLWWYEQIEVTDQGLGETARRLFCGETAAAFSSSEGCAGAFDKTPLDVLQGLPDEPVSTVSARNIWSIDDLADFARGLRKEPTDWQSFILECADRHDLLRIDAENFSSGITKHPFNGNVVRRSFALLDVLNRIAKGLQEDGSLSAAAMNLINDHFQGDKAWFSDEDPDDKDVFYFDDNYGGGKKIYCSWHGKIKTPQFRLHFQWPVPAGQKYIKVLYLGEKLTKK